MGSIEGRVGVQHLDDAQQSKNFTFKCHREGNDIYSVNSLNFHPVSSNPLMKLEVSYLFFHLDLVYFPFLLYVHSLSLRLSEKIFACYLIKKESQLLPLIAVSSVIFIGAIE